MKISLLLFAAILLVIFACKNAAAPAEKKPGAAAPINLTPEMRVPDWAKNAVIYELNTRQFSKEGTLAKAAEALPRIKNLGVDIIWLMPIYPICTTNRKCNPKEKTACMGSPYAAHDFKAVNPDLGTDADFRDFVKKAHGLGLKVILDFVPDHTGWDSKWMTEHPEYFKKIDGKMTTPVDPKSGAPTDWTDVAMLDYENKDLRKAIIDAHEYWLKEFDIDGYREDVAGFVPNDFWAELRVELDKIKPVFMLSEWADVPEHLTSCFQMNYGWNFHALIKDVYKGKKNADSIADYLVKYKTQFPKKGWQMHFTQNHDENCWNGTERESFGPAGDAFTALCFTFDGAGLIYNGQENSLDRRLSFFHKDEIDWSGKSRADFFKKLTDLKHTSKALLNGLDGGETVRIESDDPKNVLAFTREKDGDKVFCVYNLSAKARTVNLKGDGFAGKFRNVMKGTDNLEAVAGEKMRLGPWEYLVFSSK